MYYQVLENIYFFPSDLHEKNYAALIKKKRTLGNSKKIKNKLPNNYLKNSSCEIGPSLQWKLKFIQCGILR
jgi:hypothetical protein